MPWKTEHFTDSTYTQPCALAREEPLLEAAAHDVGLVDHADEAALVGDEDAVERELREVEVDERHRRACLHRVAVW